ncbi:hypothetical protein F5Y09DRAFT_315742 [Xylaria sp. FL1042]|nr:hypothetical protein F5Y09DRAFT_315742 [Xylaria sp. FL1042]
MRIPRAFLSLPPSLLFLLATQLHAQSDVSRSKSGSGSESNKDGLETLPTAVRKMSLDEGEKFMPEYFAFAASEFASGAQTPLGLGSRDVLAPTPEEEALLAGNSSAVLVFRPPFPRHQDPSHGVEARSGSKGDATDQRRRWQRSRDEEGEGAGAGAGKGAGESHWSLYRRAMEALARLQGRDFNCPSGTHVCSNIDQPNYCCPDGTTCFVVENSPDAGNVGCCPDGQTCGGSVAACSDGNTACPAEEGGGCCIPGFVCADVGCVQSTSSASTTSTKTSTSTSSNTPTASSTSSTSTPTSTPTSTAPTSSSNSDSATGTGLPPVRPTSSTPTTSSASYCPTGFYACVASAGSGCCRTGRDCSTTSCPPAASTTIITHGATIVVPLSDATAAAAAASTATATCASGWFLCGADAGPVAGCCPSGYACGTASCTLSAATATATVQKELPGNAAAGGWKGLRRGGEGALGITCVVALGWWLAI